MDIADGREQAGNLCSHCRPLLESAIHFNPFFGKTSTQNCKAVLQASRLCMLCFRLIVHIATRFRVGGSYARSDRNAAEDPALAVRILDCVGEELTLEVNYYPRRHVFVTLSSQQGADLGTIGFEIEDYALRNIFNRLRTQQAPEAKVMPGVDLQPSQLVQIKRWIEQCSHRHRKCSLERGRLHSPRPLIQRSSSSASKNWPFRPTRLINVGEDNSRIRLVLTSADSIYNYATLSHCWGTRRFQTLQSHNYHNLLEHIDPKTLTKTFLEAIALCRLLDIKYIWIDSLCIIQGSAEDFEVELGIMDQIYLNAFINFAATSSKDGSQGLFRPVNRLATGGAQIDWRTRIKNKDALHHSVLESSPVFQRGWIVQELALSPRTVHFTDTALVWECREMHTVRGENFIDRAIVPKLDLDALQSVHAMDEAWFHVIFDFAQTSVTHIEDRALALAPLATHFARRYQALGCKTTYIAGCWTHSMYLFLCWSHPSLLPHGRLKNADRSIAPSWSWQSAPKGINFELSAVHMYKMGMRDRLKLLDMEVAPRNVSMPAGPLIYGRLLVEAAWIEVEASFGSSKPHSSSPTLHLKGVKNDNGSLSEPRIDAKWDEKWWEGSEPGGQTQRNFVLVVHAQAHFVNWYVRGLVCRVSTDNLGTFIPDDGVKLMQRCGTFAFPGQDDGALPTWIDPRGRFWLV